MTRGQIAVVLPDGSLISSIEFNGDMDLTEHGKEVVDELNYIESEDEFRAFVERFNKDHFSYYEYPRVYECDDNFFDMSTDYFDKWFSDYVYIKNLSDKPVVFTDKQGRKIQIDEDTVAAFYYGEFIAAGEEDLERAEFIEQLKILKADLSYDMEKNYCDIWNACADYDNNHSGSYITDKINEYDFVTEDLLEYIVKENATDLSRLRCFINNTYDDNIYMLDGYGNLKNVDISDFENLIDDIVSDLQNEVTVPLYKEACL